MGGGHVANSWRTHRAGRTERLGPLVSVSRLRSDPTWECPSRAARSERVSGGYFGRQLERPGGPEGPGGRAGRGRRSHGLFAGLVSAMGGNLKHNSLIV